MEEPELRAREGGTTAAASDAAPTLARAAPPSTLAPPKNPAGALLLTVGATSSSDKIAGRKLLVLKADPQTVLVAGGLASTTHGTPLQTWMRACQQRTQACQQGAIALKVYTVGIATTDATGHARTPPLPTGRYWVVSDAKVSNRHMMWNQPVEVKGVDASVTLGPGNATPVE